MRFSLFDRSTLWHTVHFSSAMNRHSSPGHMYSMYTPRRIDYSTLTSSTGSSTSEPKIQFPPAKIEIEKGFVKCEGLSVSEQNKAMVCTNTSSGLYKCKMAFTPPGSSTESNENSLLSEVKEYCREGNRYKFCMETSRSSSTLASVWNRVVSIVS